MYNNILHFGRRFVAVSLLACGLVLGLTVSLSWAQDVPGVEIPESLRGMDIEREEDGRVAAIGANYILLVNVGSAVADEWLDTQRRAMRSYLGVPIRARAIDTLTPDLHPKARQDRLEDHIIAVVVLHRVSGNTSGLAVVPDARWAMVDPDWVASDGIDSETRNARLGRQLYRALGFLFGVPYTLGPHAVMKPVQKPTDLDALSINYFPGSLSIFQQHAAEFGLKSLRFLSIRERYQLGLLTPEQAAHIQAARQAEREAEELIGADD